MARFDWLVISDATCRSSLDFTDGTTFIRETHAPIRELIPITASSATIRTKGTPPYSRAFVPSSGRNLVFCLHDEPLFSQAPAAAATCAAGLSWDYPHSFVWSYDGTNLWIIGKNTESLRHGLYTLFDRLGIRFLGPHPAWKSIPATLASLQIVTELVVPKFKFFALYGNGGLSHPTNIPGQLECVDNWERWDHQQRHPREYLTGGGYSYFQERWQCYFRYAHPDYGRRMLAWEPTQNKRGYVAGLTRIQKYPGGPYIESGLWPLECVDNSFLTHKFCPSHRGSTPGLTYPDAPVSETPWTGISPHTVDCVASATPTECVGPLEDPASDTADCPLPTDFTTFGGLIKLRAEDARDVVAWKINTYGVRHPYARVTSISNVDGGNNCRCNKCASTGSITNSWYTQVKEVCGFISHWFQHSTTVKPFVYDRAYSEQIDPPDFALPPNLLVRLIISATGTYTGRSERQLTDDWLAKSQTDGFRMGMTATWLLSINVYDAPKLSPEYALTRARRWIDIGYTDLTIEGTNSQCSLGPILYVVGRMIWGDDRPWQEIIAEFFDRSFAHIKAPIVRMYERFWRGFCWSWGDIAAAWADLAEAQALLDASPDARIQTELDHLVGWVQYMRTFCELLNAVHAYDLASPAGSGGTDTALETAYDTCMFWVYRQLASCNIHAQNIGANVHSWSVDSRLGLTHPVRVKWDHNLGTSPGWATLTEATTTDMRAAVTAGLADMPAITGIRDNNFGTTLVPLTTSVSTATADGPQMSTPSRYIIQKPAGDITIQLRLSGENTAEPRVPLQVQIWDLTETTLYSTSSFTATQNTVTAHDVTLTQPAGQYLIVLVHNPGVRATSWLRVQRRYPIVMVRPHLVTRGLSVANKYYFFVPSGETKVVLNFERKYNDVTKIPYNPTFYDSTGAVVAHTTLEPNTFIATVPAGQDGKVWGWEGWYSNDSNAEPIFANCPPYFAFHPDQMMVPQELLP